MATEPCANPLLLGWVKEWLETAKERNSKGVTVYKKAYDSLKACPLIFQHPSEAQQLHGFGPKLCDRLTDKLKEHCQTANIPMPERPQKVKKTVAKNDDGTVPAKKARKPKAYVPQFRSGPYGIILALSNLGENNLSGITKQETIELAQPYCDSSYSASSDPTKFFTAWNSMKTLIDKDFVCERGRPLRRYCLTDEGFEVAKRIKAAMPAADIEQETLHAVASQTKPQDEGASTSYSGLKSACDEFRISISSAPIDLSRTPVPNSFIHSNKQWHDMVTSEEVLFSEASLPTFSPITVPPAAFTLELVLDVREVRAKTDRDYMQVELSKRGVTPVMRSLDLGDCLWVAKMKDPQLLSRYGMEGDEVMLDWIVERKRLDDLVGSIKDGRFHEQKFRLRKSGVKNVIYVVEEISMNADHFQKYEEAVESAIASSQVVNGYFIKKTQKIDDTIRYLARMTMMLKELYETKPLKVIPPQFLTPQNYLPILTKLAEENPSTNFNITYPAFTSLASKSETLTLKDVFVKMLMCTRGVTGEKALEIQRRWKTPNDFVLAFEACGSGEEGKKRKREMVSNQMGNLVGRKKVAKAVSAKIAEIWGDA